MENKSISAHNEIFVMCTTNTQLQIIAKKKGINFVCWWRASLILLVGKFSINEPWKAFVRSFPNWSAKSVPLPILFTRIIPDILYPKYECLLVWGNLQPNAVQYIQIAKVVQTEFNRNLHGSKVLCGSTGLQVFDVFTLYVPLLRFCPRTGYFFSVCRFAACIPIRGQQQLTSPKLTVILVAFPKMCISISTMW